MGFLPKDVLEGLRQAEREDKIRRSRLRLRMGEREIPILRLWHDGFAVAAEGAPALRGHVDIYDGARHIYTCLVVSGEIEGDEQVYEFKWSHPALDAAPLDFERDENAPVALLT